MTTTEDPTEEPGPPTHPAAGTTPTDSEPTPGRTSTFASFAVVPFRIIWLGTFFYYLTIFSGIIARGALAKELGGDNTALGLVTLAFGASSLVMTPLGGVMADRFPKRRILVASTLLLGLTSAFLAVTEILDVTRFWMLIMVSAIQAIAFATVLPTRMAYTAEIVGPKLIPNAVALAQISMNSNRVIAPAIAAAFLGVSWLGFSGIYVLGAVLAAASALCFHFLAPGYPNPDRPQRAPLAELVDGIRYARSKPSVRLVVVLAISVTMVGFPY
ncbi:MAG: MFS transporter, partial [Actinomycetia bacterium]|nr:MFS transporter [Actinomycetes bacterium]